MTLDHPIFTRRPAQYPDRLQLFSGPTLNGVEVGIMLEETSLAYEPHRIDIMADESHGPAIKPKRPDSVNVRGETGRAEGRRASFSAEFRFHRDAHPRHLRFRRVAEAE